MSKKNYEETKVSYHEILGAQRIYLIWKKVCHPNAKLAHSASLDTALCNFSLAGVWTTLTNK